MPYIKGVYYDSTHIKRFYRTVKFTGFKTISDDQKEILDYLVEEKRKMFIHKGISWLPVMCDLTQNLLDNRVMFPELNGDDMIYVFISLIDPELKFLEAYESSNTKEEMRATALLNFGYYDSLLAIYERIYNKRFKVCDIDELWFRDTIKRAFVPKNK